MRVKTRLHLSAITLLAPHLTEANREAILARAVHKSKRQVEELVAELSPRPDAVASIRKLPERGSAVSVRSSDDAPSVPSTASPAGGGPSGGGSQPSASELRLDGVDPGRAAALAHRSGVSAAGPTTLDRTARTAADRGCVTAIAPARYKVQFTAGVELRDKIERLRDLMRSTVPDGDLAAVIEAAVEDKLKRLEARRFGRTETGRRTCGNSKSTDSPESNADAADIATVDSPDQRTAPSSRSRHIPAAVRRAVHERDKSQCRYVDEQGRRCTARDGLEFHHRRPYGYGGEHSAANISLLCPAHNRRIAEIDYGCGLQAASAESSAAE